MIARLLISLTLLAAGFVAPAGAQTPPAPAPQSSAQPEPPQAPRLGAPGPQARATSGPERFAAQIDAFAAVDRERPPGRCPIVFTGSSSIRMWRTLEQDMAPLPALNRGFGGSQIEDVNFYFDRVVAPYRPRAIVFYAGDNDINAGRSPYQVVADFKRFMSLKSRKLGKTPVFFISLKPSKLRLAQFARQTEANFMIKELAARRSDLTYIDLVDPMLANGAPKDIFVADGLHMTPDGYVIWTSIVRAALSDAGVAGRKCR